MDYCANVFDTVEEILPKLKDCSIILVDLHGEATSEKLAMAHFLDGRVSLLVGTHTHVATADERLLPNGTAYITDVGMCGGRDSILGVQRERAIERLRTGLPVRFANETEAVELHAVLLAFGKNGKVEKIERVFVP